MERTEKSGSQDSGGGWGLKRNEFTCDANNRLATTKYADATTVGATYDNSAELRWGVNPDFYFAIASETPGFIVSPRNLTEMRGPVDITYRSPFVFGGSSGVLEYWPAANPADVRAINPNPLGQSATVTDARGGIARMECDGERVQFSHE